MNKKHPNKQYKTNVGENIYCWRKLKGLKQEDLAARVGISTTALSNIENGVSQLHIRRMEEIADALEIEVVQLMYNPRHLLNVNNQPAGQTLTSFDMALLQRLTTVMENISLFFTGYYRSN